MRRPCSPVTVTGVSKALTQETGRSLRSETTTASGSVRLAKVFCLPVGIEEMKALRKAVAASTAASLAPRLVRRPLRSTVAYR
ncbi:Uncharacterised protein [Mycobacteroides abscessus subsp. abscessus]|nr:Uncharacterised protein [Mycobacteroides abscessus subsp. abscessus]